MNRLERKAYEFTGVDEDGFACFKDPEPEMIIVSKTNDDREIVSTEAHLAKEYKIPKQK